MPRYSAARTLVSPLADGDRPWRASLVGASAEVQQHDQHSRSRDVPKGRKLLTGVASPKGPFALEESLGAASATAPPRSAPDFRAARQHLQGVHPARLVWADRVPKAEHLRRHAAADLLLDTLVYGAHSTATDALRGGLPLLTVRGEQFPQRVGASLLSAVGANQELLAVDSLRDFEDLAVSLAGTRRLRALRARLADEGRASRLFDTRA